MGTDDSWECHWTNVIGRMALDEWHANGMGWNEILVGGWATPLKNMKVNWDD